MLVLVIPPNPELAMRALHDVGNTVNTHLDAIGPTDNPKLILRAMQEGADEYLDEADFEDEIAQAVIRFKTRQAKSAAENESRGRVISNRVKGLKICVCPTLPCDNNILA